MNYNSCISDRCFKTTVIFEKKSKVNEVKIKLDNTISFLGDVVKKYVTPAFTKKIKSKPCKVSSITK